MIKSKKRPAIVFTIDGVVRRLKKEVGQAYAEKHGMAPPVPTKVGEQELIMPVVDFIREQCLARGATPIAIDMAPYIEMGQMDMAGYMKVQQELLTMLRKCEVPDPQFYFCHHAPQERIAGLDAKGRAVFEYDPVCKCRFPNANLIHQALYEQNVPVHVWESTGKMRVLPPSLFIFHPQRPEERYAALGGCGFDLVNLIAILDGSFGLKDKVDHAHLKLAREMQDNMRQNGHLFGKKVSLDGARNAAMTIEIAKN
jgi:hypothetical protein